MNGSPGAILVSWYVRAFRRHRVKACGKCLVRSGGKCSLDRQRGYGCESQVSGAPDNRPGLRWLLARELGRRVRVLFACLPIRFVRRECAGRRTIYGAKAAPRGGGTKLYFDDACVRMESLFYPGKLNVHGNAKGDYVTPLEDLKRRTFHFLLLQPRPPLASVADYPCLLLSLFASTPSFTLLSNVVPGSRNCRYRYSWVPQLILISHNLLILVLQLSPLARALEPTRSSQATPVTRSQLPKTSPRKFFLLS
jgi:hypothetical protein